MIIFNKETVNFDQWLEKLKEKAEKEKLGKAYNQVNLKDFFYMYNDGMDTDEALLEIKNKAHEQV